MDDLTFGTPRPIGTEFYSVFPDDLTPENYICVMLYRVSGHVELLDGVVEVIQHVSKLYVPIIKPQEEEDKHEMDLKLPKNEEAESKELRRYKEIRDTLYNHIRGVKSRYDEQMENERFTESFQESHLLLELVDRYIQLDPRNID